MRSSSTAIAVTFVLVVGCTDLIVGCTDARDDRSAGSVGDEGASGAVERSPECSSPVARAGPYPVMFEFTNQGKRPLFVLTECRLRYDVRSCSDGYAKTLALFDDCSVDCASAEIESSGCIACGACVHDGIEVTVDKPLASVWSGELYSFFATPNGCKCHQSRAASAGRYELTVAVYETADAARRGEVLAVVSQPFELPAPNAKVAIALVPP